MTLFLTYSWSGFVFWISYLVLSMQTQSQLKICVDSPNFGEKKIWSFKITRSDRIKLLKKLDLENLVTLYLLHLMMCSSLPELAGSVSWSGGGGAVVLDSPVLPQLPTQAGSAQETRQKELIFFLHLYFLATSLITQTGTLHIPTAKCSRKMSHST